MTDESWPEIPGYRILDEIGRGGMGVVYLATPDSDPDDRVAVKVLPRGVAIDEQEMRRFQREGKVGQGLSHPNILPVREILGSEEAWSIVMDYVDGSTLSQRLRSGVDKPIVEGNQTPSSLKRSSAFAYLRAMAQVADALSYAHRNGVIHRDIKPGNILIRSSDHHPFLIDFGLARNLFSDSTILTSTGTVLGTPSYMAPEQLMSGEVGPGTDIYGLGVTVFEIACGRVPFLASSLEGLASRVIHDDPPLPSETGSQAPRELDAVILRALEKKPEHRYPTAEAFRDDLRSVIEGGRATGTFQVRARRALRATMRHRTKMLVALILVIAGAALWFYLQKEEKDLERMARSLFVQARYEVEQGQIQAALARIDRAIELRQDHPEGYLQKAAALAADRRFDDRERALTRAVELGFLAREDVGATPPDLYLTSLYFLALRDDVGAERLLVRATAEEGAAPIYFLLLNQVLSSQKKVEAARQVLDRGSSIIRGQFFDDPIVQAVFLQSSGEMEQAVRLLEDRDREQRTGDLPDGRLLAQLGSAYMWLERYEDAEQTFRRVLDQDPDNASARSNLAVALMQLEKTDDAVAAARSALQRDPRLRGGRSVLARVAHIRLIEDDPAAAGRLLEEALTVNRILNPESLLSAEQAFRAGGNHQKLGEYKLAREQFLTCISLDRGHVGAHTMLAQDDWVNNRTVAARREFDGALEAWRKYERIWDLGLRAWREPQCRPSFQAAIQIGRFALAGEARDDTIAGAALAELKEILARKDRLDIENALNLAEALAVTPLEDFRDCDLARKLVEEYELRSALAGDDAANQVLDAIDEACPEGP